MKKVNLTVAYHEEKLSALRLYLGQKELAVETELAAALENLYAKTVPANVREFIDLRAGIEAPVEKRKKPRPASEAVSPAPEGGEAD